MSEYNTTNYEKNIKEILSKSRASLEGKLQDYTTFLRIEGITTGSGIVKGVNESTANPTLLNHWPVLFFDLGFSTTYNQSIMKNGTDPIYSIIKEPILVVLDGNISQALELVQAFYNGSPLGSSGEITIRSNASASSAEIMKIELQNIHFLECKKEMYKNYYYYFFYLQYQSLIGSLYTVLEKGVPNGYLTFGV